MNINGGNINSRRPVVDFRKPRFDARSPVFVDPRRSRPKVQVFDGRNPGGNIRW